MARHSTTDNSFFSALGIAIGLHLILLIVLIVSIKWQSQSFGLKAGPSIMHATALFDAPLKEQRVIAASPQAPQKPLEKIEAIKPIKDPKAIAIQKQKPQDFKKTVRSPVADQNAKTAAAENQVMQGLVDQYKALILQAISQYWIVPPDANKRSSCVLLLRLAPDGTVLSVKLARSSGNSALDDSALAAVEKASPLPVPTERNAFEAFREIQLTVRPDTIRAGS